MFDCLKRNIVPSLLFALMIHAAPAAVSALELSLDAVRGITKNRDVEFTLNNKATFDFNPDTGILTSAGTWLAQHEMGQGGLVSYSHKVENFKANSDGEHSAKAYECVEGTLGMAYLNANVCGSYTFGVNKLDDGGLVDDVIVGPPHSLRDYELSGFSWDGSELIVILSATDLAIAGIDRLASLKLTLSAIAAECREENASSENC